MKNKIERGYIVKLKSGKEGFTKHSDPEVNGKVPVYITENFKPTGEKLLCNPDSLTIIGFKD